MSDFYSPRDRALSAMRWLYIMAIFLAVVPNGSFGEINYFLNSIIFGLLFAATAFVKVNNAHTRTTLALILAIILSGSAYIAFQAWPMVDHPFVNPAWQDVISEGITDRGAISVAPGETIAAIPALVVPFLVFAIGLILHQDDRAARALWTRLAVFAGILAVIALIRHEFFRDSYLFGTRPRGDAVLTGSFFNRNLSASFFVMASFATLGMAIMQTKKMGWESVKRRFSKFDYFDDRKYLLFGLACFLFLASLVALFLTQSRGGVGFGLLALVVSVIVIAGSGGGASKVPLAARVVAMTAIGAVSVVAFVILGGRTILRVDGDGFDGARACVSRSVMSGIADYPIFGIGFGAFKEMFPVYRQPECGTTVTWHYAHNAWLEGYWALGFPFAILVLVCLWQFSGSVAVGLRSRRRFRFIPILISCVLLYMSLHSTLDFPIQIPGIAIFFAAFLSAGVAISTAR